MHSSPNVAVIFFLEDLGVLVTQQDALRRICAESRICDQFMQPHACMNNARNGALLGRRCMFTHASYMPFQYVH